MPDGDGTGPRGRGPGTGRGQGRCRGGMARGRGQGQVPGQGVEAGREDSGLTGIIVRAVVDGLVKLLTSGPRRTAPATSRKELSGGRTERLLEEHNETEETQ